MSDVHALSGAYSIDALDEVERHRFEQHLALCAECRVEVVGLAETASSLAEIAVQSTSVELRARVLSDIARVRPLPPLGAPLPAVVDLAPRRSRRSLQQWRRRPLLVAVAAAAVVAAVGIGGVVVQPQDDGPGLVQALPDPAAAVLAAPDAEPHVSDLPGVGGSATVTVVRSRELGQAVVSTQNMPELSRSEVYQLWLRVDGSMVSAGLTGAADSTLLLQGDAGDAEAVGVTVEPAGGSPRPTTQPVAYIPLGTV